MAKASWWNTFGMPKEEPLERKPFIRDEKEGQNMTFFYLVILVIGGPFLMKYQDEVWWLDFNDYYCGMLLGIILTITCLIGFRSFRNDMGFKLYVNDEEEE